MSEVLSPHQPTTEELVKTDMPPSMKPDREDQAVESSPAELQETETQADTDLVIEDLLSLVNFQQQDAMEQYLDVVAQFIQQKHLLRDDESEREQLISDISGWLNHLRRDERYRVGEDIDLPDRAAALRSRADGHYLQLIIDGATNLATAEDTARAWYLAELGLSSYQPETLLEDYEEPIRSASSAADAGTNESQQGTLAGMMTQKKAAEQRFAALRARGPRKPKNKTEKIKK